RGLLSGRGLGDLARPDAPRAGGGAPRDAVDHRADTLEVDVPLPVRQVVGMADAVSRHRRFSAEVTVLSHGSPRSGCLPKKPAKPTTVRRGMQGRTADLRRPHLSEWLKSLPNRMFRASDLLTTEKPFAILETSRISPS